MVNKSEREPVFSGQRGLVFKRKPGWIERGMRAVAAAAVTAAGVVGAVEVVKPGSMSEPMAATIRNVPKNVGNVWEKLTDEKLTREQVRAAVYYNAATEEQFVHNLVATGAVGRDGKTINVNLRTRPATPGGGKEPDGVAGEVIGALPAGTVIESAIVVWGRDPLRPDDSSRRGRWLAFPDPNNFDRIVFAHDGVFEYNPRLHQIEPIDLSQP